MLRAGAVGIIGAEHDLRHADQLGDRFDRDFIRHLRRVVEEPFQFMIDHLAGEFSFMRRCVDHLDAQPLRHRRQYAAAVGENEANIGAFRRRAAEDQIGNRAGRIGAILDRRVGHAFD